MIDYLKLCALEPVTIMARPDMRNGDCKMVLAMSGFGKTVIDYIHW